MTGPSSLGRGRLSWADVAVSAVLVLVIAVPTMIIEEDWHGHPMIEQPGHLWIIPASIVTVAFLFGGTVAGYRSPSTAVLNATLAASIAVVVLLLGAGARRVWVVHSMSIAVGRLWCLGVAAALVLSVAGSLFGRLLRARAH
jgi:hypothetical protein